MSETRTPIKFHIEEIALGKWKIIYDEPITARVDDRLVYEYGEGEFPEKIWLVKGNPDG